jgi:SAM-dependent methyltransferase
MGLAEPVTGERVDPAGAEPRPTKVFASNTGVCAEDALREGEIGLNLGSGKIRWPGWQNVDGFNDRADVKADLKALPFPHNYADRVVAIHVFEHFYLWETPVILEEWKRVLKPGGRIVLEMPNMEAVFSHIAVRMRKGEAPVPTMSWLAIWGDPRHEDPAMCHRWGYSPIDVVTILKKAGFENVQSETARYHFPARDMRITATKPGA